MGLCWRQNRHRDKKSAVFSGSYFYDITSELHVGYDDLFADARQRVWILKEVLVVFTVSYRGQELNGVTDQLKGDKTGGNVD